MCRKAKEKERKRNKSPSAKQALGKSGRWLFLHLILMQNWLFIDAAAGRLEPKGEAEVLEIIIVSVAVEGTFVDLHSKSRQEEHKGNPRKWKRSKGVDWTVMRKEEKRLRCTLLNGSVWSTEKKYMRRYKGKCAIFFGIEHRLRQEEMEEQFNKEAKEGWRFAASAARISEETAGDEDRKHTSGGVFVAIDSNARAVVGADEGAIESIPASVGECQRRVSHFLRVLLAFGRMDAEKRSHHGSGAEKSSDHKASMADSMGC